MDGTVSHPPSVLQLTSAFRRRSETQTQSFLQSKRQQFNCSNESSLSAHLGLNPPANTKRHGADVPVLPILSGRSNLKETVEVPRPPVLVVTMISPLSSLAGPTRHTILLADIHSAVSRQLWPQIDRPEIGGEREI